MRGIKNQERLAKGPKLKKKYWMKGKSKHLFCRMREEGITDARDLDLVVHADKASRPAKLSWWQLILNFLRYVFRR